MVTKAENQAMNLSIIIHLKNFLSGIIIPNLSLKKEHLSKN